MNVAACLQKEGAIDGGQIHRGRSDRCECGRQESQQRQGKLSLVQLVWVREMSYVIKFQDPKFLFNWPLVNAFDVTLPLHSPNNCIPIPY